MGALTSGENGTLVTIGVAVNAVSNTVPMIFDFNRNRMIIFHWNCQRNRMDARSKFPRFYQTLCQTHFSV